MKKLLLLLIIILVGVVAAQIKEVSIESKIKDNYDFKQVITNPVKVDRYSQGSDIDFEITGAHAMRVQKKDGTWATLVISDKKYKAMTK